MKRVSRMTVGLAALMVAGLPAAVPGSARAEGPASGGPVTVDVGLYL